MKQPARIGLLVGVLAPLVALVAMKVTPETLQPLLFFLTPVTVTGWMFGAMIGFAAYLLANKLKRREAGSQA